ncbi:hypothetical protein [Pontibacter sp. G13]|uniref:hypothetical protein n=1 Tax=Pontibacter sp. G13 TaxID=3074898 RepID=UPI00288AF5E2|nr:hypothetical protein [Pontibacter sp. G13]WNJ19714.1 hypothetical protein RJD25_04460 [Pontibacter sp. G13]
MEMQKWEADLLANMKFPKPVIFKCNEYFNIVYCLNVMKAGIAARDREEFMKRRKLAFGSRVWDRNWLMQAVFSGAAGLCGVRGLKG